LVTSSLVVVSVDDGAFVEAGAGSHEGDPVGRVDRAPVAPTFASDLGQRHTPLTQGTEPTNIHPGPLIDDHEQVALRAHQLCSG